MQQVSLWNICLHKQKSGFAHFVKHDTRPGPVVFCDWWYRERAKHLSSVMTHAKVKRQLFVTNLCDHYLNLYSIDSEVSHLGQGRAKRTCFPIAFLNHINNLWQCVYYTAGMPVLFSWSVSVSLVYQHPSSIFGCRWGFPRNFFVSHPTHVLFALTGNYPFIQNIYIQLLRHIIVPYY